MSIHSNNNCHCFSMPDDSCIFLGLINNYCCEDTRQTNGKRSHWNAFKQMSIIQRLVLLHYTTSTHTTGCTQKNTENLRPVAQCYTEIIIKNSDDYSFWSVRREIFFYFSTRHRTKYYNATTGRRLHSADESGPHSVAKLHRSLDVYRCSRREQLPSYRLLISPVLSIKCT